MGCSASRPNTLLARPTEEPPSNSPSRSLSSYSDSSSTPISRTLSLPTPLVHHPPVRKGDTNHLVSLTSTTYGSLVLIDSIPNATSGPDKGAFDASSSPTHPTKTLKLTDSVEPSSPDSVINTWELMEGLDDFDFDFIPSAKLDSSIYDFPVESSRKPNSYQCSGCRVPAKKACGSHDLEKSFEMVEHSDSKPLWKHLSEESLLAKMDPNVVLSYRRALSSRQLGFKESKDTKPATVRPLTSLISDTECRLQGTEDTIVVYHTSLRGIRRTYEDCCAVRMIFRGFRVRVDERDISMDSAYRKELQSMLGGKAVSLPQVFIRGKYVGGAEEIKQLNEVGELAKILEGFPVRDPGFVCKVCGDVGFVPCPSCNGSRKIFEEEQGKARRCPDCNENGLIRCPSCCS